MAQIENGQIYTRISPPDSKFFPEKSWKVFIVGVEGNKILHRMCEYNGDKRSGGQIFEMQEDLFLESYTLDE